MKVVACLLVLVAFASSAPHTRKDFHEHFEDFIQLILAEAGAQIDELRQTYSQFEEFNSALEYMSTASFKEIILEMEALPEFQALVDFLEADDIDITYFLDIIDEIVISIPSRSSGRQASGTSMTSFIQDSIAVFPQAKLDALFKQKKEEDETFANAIDNLFSDEWNAVFTALWETPQFQQEVETLLSNGIDVNEVLNEIIAVFGQNF